MSIQNKIIEGWSQIICLVMIGQKVEFKHVRPEVQIRVERSKLLRQINRVDTHEELDKAYMNFKVFHDKYINHPEILSIASELTQNLKEKGFVLIHSKVQ